MQHVAEQQRVLALDEAQRSGAEELVDVALAGLEERADRLGARADPVQHGGRIGVLHELAAEHPGDDVEAHRRRAAARDRELDGQPEAVAPRRRQVRDRSQQRGARILERQRGDLRRGAARRRGRALGRDRLPVAALPHVAVQERFGGGVEGRLVRSRPPGRGGDELEQRADVRLARQRVDERELQRDPAVQARAADDRLAGSQQRALGGGVDGVEPLGAQPRCRRAATGTRP